MGEGEKASAGPGLERGECGCHVGRVTPVPRSYRHNEVVVLSAFAQAVLELHRAIDDAVARRISNEIPGPSVRAYDAAWAAVRAAQMLELREEYR